MENEKCTAIVLQSKQWILFILEGCITVKNSSSSPTTSPPNAEKSFPNHATAFIAYLFNATS